MQAVVPGTVWTVSNPDDMRALPAPSPAPEPVAAPVEGYRVWRVHRDDHVTLTRQLVQQLAAEHEPGRNPFRALLPGARLHPVASWTGAWERVHTAVCTQHSQGYSVTAVYYPPPSRHEAPQRGCGCGLWALKDESEARAVAAGYQLRSGYAVGKLRLWGRVVEHTRGYRGQHAQPLELTYVGEGPEAGEVAGELSAFYGCPCTVQTPAVPRTHPLRFDPTAGRTLTAAQLQQAAGASSIPPGSGLQTFITTNVTNSGLAAQLVQQQSAANNAAIAYIAGNSAPYDQGGRRAWPVRFARWTLNHDGWGFAIYMLLGLGPLCAAIVGVFGLGVPWAGLAALLGPAWFIFWNRANK